MLPKFLIPGAGKSGTSSLSYYIRQHPNIFIPHDKEPAFFSTIEGVGQYLKGLQWYSTLFDGAAGGTVCGEASTIYMYDPESPGLISKHLGNIKLIFILREPVSRTYSNYWQDLKAGRFLPGFSELIHRVDMKNYNKYRPDMFKKNNRGWAYVYASDYQLHLKRFLKYFPKELMLFLLFEELKLMERNFFEKIFSFLGVDCNFVPRDLRRINEPSLPKSRILECLYRSRIRRIPLKAVTPRIFWVLKSIRLRNQTACEYHPMNTKTRNNLVEFFRPRVEELEALTGLDLRYWREVES